MAANMNKGTTGYIKRFQVLQDPSVLMTSRERTLSQMTGPREKEMKRRRIV